MTSSTINDPEPHGMIGSEIYRSLFLAAAEALVLFDDCGSPLDVNPVAAALLGYTRAELLALGLHNVIVRWSRCTPCDQAPVPDGGRWRGTVEVRRRDRSHLTLEVVATTIVSPLGVILFCVLRHHTVECQLAHERLEHRVHALLHQGVDLLSLMTPDEAGDRIFQRVDGLLGYGSEELSCLSLENLVHADDRAAFEAGVVAAHEGGTDHRFTEIQVRHKDGSWRWMEAWFSNLLDDADLGGIIVSCRDITSRKSADEALRQKEASLAEAQRLAHVGSWEWRLASNEVTWSEELYRIVGKDPEQWAPSYEGFLEHVHLEDRSRVHGLITQAMRTGGRFGFEHRLADTSGTERTVVVNGAVLVDDEGQPIGLRGTVQDVSERRRIEAELHYLAFHDGLTGLSSRTGFIHRLEQTLVGGPHPSEVIAVLFLDLDRFKLVNDSLGHSYGDQVLIAAAARLMSLLREGDTLARFGGDEFAAIVAGRTTPHDVESIAQRMLAAFEAPFQIQGQELRITISLGIAFDTAVFRDEAPLAPDHSVADRLIQAADIAMYHAKTKRPGEYAIFDQIMTIQAVERLTLESDLQRAVERGELVLYYQPQIHGSSGRVVAVEALLRWNHPRRGLLQPGDFMQLAVETGLIVPIGRWVVETACRQAVEWGAMSGRFTEWARISVNLSSQELRQPDVVEYLNRVLDRTGLQPEVLEIEITEQAALDDEQVLAMVLRFNAMGIRLALDDFGTGYSALSSLRRLPIDTLKFDRSFMHDVSGDAKTTAIVQAVTDLAHNHGIQVVAEGVETPAEFEAVRTLGIDRVQGDYVAPSMTAGDCTAFLLATGTL